MLVMSPFVLEICKENEGRIRGLHRGVSHIVAHLSPAVSRCKNKADDHPDQISICVEHKKGQSELFRMDALGLTKEALATKFADASTEEMLSWLDR